MTGKKLTPEQKRREIAKKTLEHFLDFVGANETKHRGGELGDEVGSPIYKNFLKNDKKADEARDIIYEKDKAEAGMLGNYEHVPTPQNFQVVQYLLNQIHENQMRLKLGELEEIVTGITGKLEFKVPEGLKNHSYLEIVQKALNEEGKLDLSKLDKNEQVAYTAYTVFDKAYKSFAAQKLMAGHYMDGVNAAGKKLFKPYKEAKKEKK